MCASRAHPIIPQPFSRECPPCVRHKLDLAIEEKIFVSNDLEDLRAESLRTEQGLRSYIEVTLFAPTALYSITVGCCGSVLAYLQVVLAYVEVMLAYLYILLAYLQVISHALHPPLRGVYRIL